MSYREHELEQAYDRLEDQYWELIDWLKLHAPLTLHAFKNRRQNLYYIICTMESGQTVTWEDYADDEGHAEGLAIAYAIEQTGEQVYKTYMEINPVEVAE